MKPAHAIMFFALTLSLLAGGRARAEFFIGLDGGTSLSNTLKFATDELAADILVKGGYRFGRWGVFAQIGYNSWVSMETDSPQSPSATNIGAGSEVLYFNGRARTSLAIGPSIYNTDTTGEAGSLGFFIDLRPVGFRFPVGEHWTLGFDPIAFNFTAPVLSKIPLLVAEYVSLVTLEYSGSIREEPQVEFAGDGDIHLFLQADFHFSVLSDDPERSMLADTLGFGFRVGFRFDEWAIFLHLENNRWFTSELGTMSLTPGSINAGLGGEYLYFGGRARSSLVFGSSALMMDTFLLDAGEVGLFFEIRPLGFRFPVADNLFVVFDPLTFAMVAPDLGQNALVMKEYRTLVGMEVGL